MKAVLQETKKAQKEAAADGEDKPTETESSKSGVVAELLPGGEHKTGEEDEEHLFMAQDVKVYNFNDGKWKECGRGELHVNKNTAKNYSRVIMRRKNTRQVVLNGRLWPEMMSKVVSDKEVRLSFTDDEGGVQMFSIRVLRPAGGAKELNNIIEANKPKANA